MVRSTGNLYTVPIKSALNPIAAASSRIAPEELCEAVGLDPRRLGDPHGRLPLGQLIALYEAGARMTRDSAFGLHVAARTNLRAFGVLGYIFMNSATVGLAFERLVRYLPIWTDGARFLLYREGPTFHLVWQYVDQAITECRHDCEMTLLSTLKGVSSVAEPREVRFQHSSPKNIGEHRRLFGARVYFRADQNEIIFERAAITAPIENADPDLCDVLAGVAEDMLGVRSSNPVDRIRLAVSQSLGKSDMGLESVSRSIGVSARALQRRLKQHGTSFTELRREVRQQLAERTLGDPQMTIAEIAYRLGYSEPSEFHRAFRSWTGSSPKQYRRLLSSRNS